MPQSRRQLLPRRRGGNGGPTVLLHAICRKELHATLSTSELARTHTTPEPLHRHPRLAHFIIWVANRPPGFTSRVPGPRRGR